VAMIGRRLGFRKMVQRTHRRKAYRCTNPRKSTQWRQRGNLSLSKTGLLPGHRLCIIGKHFEPRYYRSRGSISATFPLWQDIYEAEIRRRAVPPVKDTPTVVSTLKEAALLGASALVEQALTR